jgi:hypothetical protein
MMVEAVTVRWNRTVPFWTFVIKISASKFFDIRILPASDCAP